ncbi:MAG: hypothetical protein QOJ46_1006 [bacterium]
MATEPKQRASWWEILGAWLRVWTPPRDVEIPSPRRALSVAFVVVAVVAVAGVTLVAPAIDRAKKRADHERALQYEVARISREARLETEQRAHHGRAPQVARLYAAGRREASITALIAAARASVGRDVRARVAAGALAGPIRRVQCSSRSRELGARVHLDCLAVTAAHTHKRIHELLLGHPFVVGATLGSGRYAWCKDNQKPAEGSFGNNIQVPLPGACTG